MTRLRQAGLFEGYGGLSMAVAEVLGAELTWYSEVDPAASRLLAHHHPGIGVVPQQAAAALRFLLAGSSRVGVAA